MQKKVGTIFVEIIKIGLCCFLLWPLTKNVPTWSDFVRIVAGILLFILIVGKVFYDKVLSSYIDTKNRTKDLLIIFLSVVVLALIVAVAILSIALLVVERMP